MKRILLMATALATATALTGAANAADVRHPPPLAPKAPAYVVAPFSWAGFYLGGNIGYGWSSGSGTLTATSIAPAGTTGPMSVSGSGILGGLQAGYNWQAGAFVYGVETDFQFSGGEGAFAGNVAGARTFAGTASNEWFGTIRGRRGYAVDRWLFYVTGGAADTHNTSNGTTTFGGVTTPITASATGWTYAVGGGVEAALWQNWSVKGEYLYLGTPSHVPTPPGTTASGNLDSHVIRIGLNYHF
jgi:outer membrane immunogenic protein